MAENSRGRAEMEAGAAGVQPASRPTIEPERRLPPEAEAAHRVPEYEDPETARRHIEATRARLSGTIDEIEDSLVRKKERIQDRLDIAAPIRQRPWPAIGIALGAGLLLGILTGGSDDDDEDEYASYGDGGRDRHWQGRARMLESRSRRLLRIAREQEEELERLRRRRPRGRTRLAEEDDAHGADDSSDDRPERVEYRTRFDELRETILSQLADYVRSALR